MLTLPVPFLCVYFYMQGVCTLSSDWMGLYHSADRGNFPINKNCDGYYFALEKQEVASFFFAGVIIHYLRSPSQGQSLT